MSGLVFVSRRPVFHRSLKELSSTFQWHCVSDALHLSRLFCSGIVKTYRLTPALSSAVVIGGAKQREISCVWQPPEPRRNSRCHCTTTWKQPCQLRRQISFQNDYSAYVRNMKTAALLQRALRRQPNSQRWQRQQANPHGLAARLQVPTTLATPLVSAPCQHPFDARAIRQSCSDSVSVGISWLGVSRNTFLCASSHLVNTRNNCINITRAFSNTSITGTSTTRPKMGLKELQDAKAKFEPSADLGTKVSPFRA